MRPRDCIKPPGLAQLVGRALRPEKYYDAGVLPPERRVGPAVVVLVHVGRSESARILEVRVLVEVEAVVLQISEPALDVDVVDSAGLAVHALGDPVARQTLHVLVGRAGAALVAAKPFSV